MSDHNFTWHDFDGKLVDVQKAFYADGSRVPRGWILLFGDNHLYRGDLQVILRSNNEIGDIYSDNGLIHVEIQNPKRAKK